MCICAIHIVWRMRFRSSLLAFAAARVDKVSNQTIISVQPLLHLSTAIVKLPTFYTRLYRQLTFAAFAIDCSVQLLRSAQSSCCFFTIQMFLCYIFVVVVVVFCFLLLFLCSILVNSQAAANYIHTSVYVYVYVNVCGNCYCVRSKWRLTITVTGVCLLLLDWFEISNSPVRFIFLVIDFAAVRIRNISTKFEFGCTHCLKVC